MLFLSRRDPMRATAIAANTSASSDAKQFQRVLLLSALFVTPSLNSWAQIVVSPASLTFSKTIVGVTSAAKTVTITNNGASAQPINPIVMSGDFTTPDHCGGSIAGGGTCTAHIFFTPTIVGAISGAATIVDPSGMEKSNKMGPANARGWKARERFLQGMAEPMRAGRTQPVDLPRL